MWVGLVCVFGSIGGAFREASAQTVTSTDMAAPTTQAELPIAFLGVPYQINLTGSGGVPPYRLELVRGQLPNGMNFDTSGRLVGSPGSTGSFLFRVSLRDSENMQTSQDFHLLVGMISPGAVPTLAPEAPGTSPAPVGVPIVPPVLPPAPSLPSGMLPFAQPPVLGGYTSGIGSALLPYNPGVLPAAPDAPMVVPMQDRPAPVVGAATTSTPSELLHQLDTQGIAVQSLVKIPYDPSGVNDNVTYYIGADGRRHAFSHPSVLESWYPNGAPTARTLSMMELQAIPLGVSVSYRPGTKVLQFEGPTMYAVTGPGTLRPLRDAQAAESVYGSSWFNHLVGLSDAYFAGYHLTGEVPIATAGDVSPSSAASVFASPSDVLVL